MPPVHRPAATADRVRCVLGVDPFRVRDALAAGFTEGQLRAARRAGLLQQLRPGVLALAATPAGPGTDPVRRAALAALAALAPTAVVSIGSARHLHGLPHPLPGVSEVGRPVTVTAPVSGRRRAGIHVVEGLVAPEDVEIVHGVRCTSLARTALDVARGRPLPQSLVVLDAAVGRVGADAVSAALRRHPVDRCRGGLERAVALADGRSESPLESASRGTMLAAGLELPELQAWVVDDEGRAWRVDFLWRAQRVVGEADGWDKYRKPADLRSEKMREDALRRAGWTVIRWTSDELWRSPDLVLARIRRSLGG